MIYRNITVHDHLYTPLDTQRNMPTIQFGTEPFTAASNKVEGIPDHAALIEGRLIHLDTKNLKGWGVTAAAANQIIEGIKGIPIRACNNPDPHACDYNSDNFSNVGYATGARIEDGWIIAKSAITDRDAVQKINDKTWMPFGQGGWSVTGFPSDPTEDFEKSGLTNGFAPASIALIIGNGKPAFEGSGFDMVAAAISNHRGDNMAEEKETFTRDDLDKIVKDALEKQKTELEAAGNKHTAEELAKQKLEHDAAIEKLAADDRAAFNAKLAEMTPTPDVEKMISAAVSRGQADTIEAIEREKLATEYQGLLTASIIGAPFMTDGKPDQAKIDTKMAEVRGMKSAAISGMISEAKILVAAATPAAGSPFDDMEIPEQAPGSPSQEAQDMAAIDELREATGRV
ncbi:MAG: hypothetical protein U9R21_04335 [Candidatus Thermoplasmatota archaeon]|nr:hypothetical protein [Candidatus Thermoplasmatota archaeon]